MKNLFYSLLFCALVLGSCNSEQEEEVVDDSIESFNTTRISLSIDDAEAKTLSCSDNKGLKSSAIEYSCTVEIGDTIYWDIEEGSNIESIEDIVIITSDFGEDNLFVNGVIFNEDKTECYGVISEEAYGSTKYNIDFLYEGNVITDDPELDIDPPK
jgi:uncharacterized protein YcfL